MREIFTRDFQRTLDAMVEQATSGQSFEAWTFDDIQSRRRAEQRLAAKGVAARIRSAYKPLLHAFLEEIDLAGVERIEIHYPVHAQAAENRFRLEAYPLAALVGNAELTFTPRLDDAFQYDVLLTRPLGTEALTILAPNHVHVDAIGQTVVSPPAG